MALPNVMRVDFILFQSCMPKIFTAFWGKNEKECLFFVDFVGSDDVEHYSISLSS